MMPLIVSRARSGAMLRSGKIMSCLPRLLEDLARLEKVGDNSEGSHISVRIAGSASCKNEQLLICLRRLCACGPELAITSRKPGGHARAFVRIGTIGDVFLYPLRRGSA